MSNILEKIIADKRKEVALKKQIIPVEAWERFPHYTEKRHSLKKALLKENTTGIIAEFKRKSPSKGIINATAAVDNVVSAYNLGAAGISILTDEIYFGGTNDDMLLARQIASTPLLRKDFIIDEYQLEEARGIGADVILLIAACLTKQEVKRLAQKARSLSLEVLLEIHNEQELGHICDEADLIGINNRNLKTFNVDIEPSVNLFEKISKDKIVIAESGINNIDTIITLRKAGFKGFLIGEYFMKQNDPAIAFAEFIQKLQARIK
jgi:indole-3-glycerol phosphate synthase